MQSGSCREAAGTAQHAALLTPGGVVSETCILDSMATLQPCSALASWCACQPPAHLHSCQHALCQRVVKGRRLLLHRLQHATQGSPSVCSELEWAAGQADPPSTEPSTAIS